MLGLLKCVLGVSLQLDLPLFSENLQIVKEVGMGTQSNELGKSVLRSGVHI